MNLYLCACITWAKRQMFRIPVLKVLQWWTNKYYLSWELHHFEEWTAKIIAMYLETQKKNKYSNLKTLYEDWIEQLLFTLFGKFVQFCVIRIKSKPQIQIWQP